MAIQDSIHQWQEIYTRIETLEAEMRQLRTLFLTLRPTASIVNVEERKRRAIAAAGRFRSGLANLSTDHDHYLTEAYQA